MSGSRSTTGCYTCRLRKKKCYELHPICLNCSSRSIPCYGYGAKPEWADGAELEALKVKEIKRAAEANYRARRRRWKPSVVQAPHQDSGQYTPGKNVVLKPDLDAIHLTDWEKDKKLVYQTASKFPVDTTSLTLRQNVATEAQTAADGQAKEFTARAAQQLFLGNDHRVPCPSTINSMWWHSGFTNTYQIKNNKELGLLMNYLDNVFCLQFGFDRSCDLGYGRGWFLNILLRSPSLYFATLSLSAHHQSLLRDGNINNPKGFSADAEQSYALALRGLQQMMGTVQHLNGVQLLTARFCLLGAIEQILSLEVFRELGGNWEIHLKAGRTFLSMIGSTAVSSTTLPDAPEPLKRLDMIEAVLKGPEYDVLSSGDKMALKFFVTGFAWIDIISYASGLRDFDDTTFDYLSLLEDNTLELHKVMGCENWVMVIMAKIAQLDEWKRRANLDGKLSAAKLVAQAAIIEKSLERGITKVLEARTGLQGLDLNSNLVTEIFAYGSLTYLHVVVSGAHSQVLEIRRSVERTLNSLWMLPYRLLIRVSWPFCITGCMAVPEEESVFESISSRAVAAQPTGTIWKALVVMRESWRINRVQVGAEHGWTNAMENIGVKILLV